MMGSVPILPAILGTVLLCGCAAASQSSPASQGVEPDCSFRSATTCWTLAGRFPPPRAQAGDPPPGDVLKQRPPVLASRADSALKAR
jgi:hypothetical protein